MKILIRRPRPPAFVNATQEVKDLLDSLAPGSYELGIIHEATDKLRENMLVGEQVKRELFPKCYVRKHNITNLYKLDLDHQRRLIYTLITDVQGVGVLVLEIFQNHKEYEKRMGYA